MLMDYLVFMKTHIELQGQLHEKSTFFNKCLRNIPYLNKRNNHNYYTTFQ